MLIWYVHGAGASEKSFNWLSKQLPQHEAKFLSYTTRESASEVAKRLSAAIDEPCVLLGHSLGGIIATLCTDHPHVQKLITISAPFGGVRHAEFLSLFSFEPLFSDIRTHGSLLTKARNKTIDKPHLAIVGSGGLPFFIERNDGALTVDGQTAKKNTHYEIVPINHFEVLLSMEVAILIASFLQ